jgi:ABC-2 type transport system ATP-binding protein
MIRCDRASIELGGQLVVAPLSLHVRAGEAWAIVGRTGAGKSSLLAAMATALPLHGGDMLVHGRSVRREPEAVRRLIGYAPAVPPDWPGLRAGELLEVFASAAGLQAAAARQAVEKSLVMAGLAGRSRVELDSLPAGQAKHLLIARALLHEPEALLFDDPFSGLDPGQIQAVERLIGDAHLMGKTVLAAIDDGRVPGCFTHLAVLREGRLVAEGRNDPAAFAAGRHWRVVIRSSGRAPAVAKAVRPLGVEAEAFDDDTVAARVEPGLIGPPELVAAVVRAGLPVESAGYDPPWQAQLVDERAG